MLELWLRVFIGCLCAAFTVAMILIFKAVIDYHFENNPVIHLTVLVLYFSFAVACVFTALYKWWG